MRAALPARALAWFVDVLDRFWGLIGLAVCLALHMLKSRLVEFEERQVARKRRTPGRMYGAHWHHRRHARTYAVAPPGARLDVHWHHRRHAWTYASLRREPEPTRCRRRDHAEDGGGGAGWRPR